MTADLATLSRNRRAFVAAMGACAGFSMTLSNPAAAQTLAFPGAEGAGRFSQGGRGGQVMRVTHLGNEGPGSLRHALEASGPRTIIFDIGGTIRLTRPLVVRQGRVTLAGQTAPGGGITLRDQPLIIAADDVVVRFIRSRLGDESGVEADAMEITRGRRIILDHVSASWSVDETLSAGSRYDPPDRGVHDVTVQWSIISESLNASRHDKGDHGYGSLLRGGYGSRMTFHHNLWSSHSARMPRPGNYVPATQDPQGAFFEFRNNVLHNWGGGYAGYNADTDSRSTYVFAGNAYVRGPDSRGGAAFRESNPLARAWFEGNAMDGAVPDDPWALVDGPGARTPGYRLPARPPWADAPARTAAQALDAVLAGAGASHARDAVDARVVAGVRAGAGRIIDSQADVGGWPDLAPGAPWIDSDGDGLPDDWERAHGLDPHDPADGGLDPDGDGHTNLEDWLNHLAETPTSR